MAGYDGSIRIDTRVDSRGFNNGIRNMSAGLAGLGRAIKGVGVALEIAFTVKKLIDFGREAVSLASDLEEVQNVVDVSFGDMAYKMKEFADTAIETFGMSRLEAKETGSTFMVMARGMGMASDKASDMSLNLTALSADMASFYNKDFVRQKPPWLLYLQGKRKH